MRGRTPYIAACTSVTWLPTVDVSDRTTGGEICEICCSVGGAAGDTTGSELVAVWGGEKGEGRRWWPVAPVSRCSSFACSRSCSCSIDMRRHASSLEHVKQAVTLHGIYSLCLSSLIHGWPQNYIASHRTQYRFYFSY